MNSVVSIIVPVYNVAIFLSECLNSVLDQTYIYWELILVDDGSTDASSNICDEYASKDSRIRVVHKINSGVSDTRNKALDLATGKYVIFLDADDYWYDEKFLEQMISLADNYNLDIIRGEYKAVNNNGELLFSHSISSARLAMSGKIISSYGFLKYCINGEFFLVLSLFRRSILKNIRFENGRIFLEDMRFYSQVLLQDLRCMYLPELRFYAYRKNFASASFSFNPQKVRDAFDMCDFFYSLSKETEKRELKVLYQKMCIYMYYSTLGGLADGEYYINRKKYIVNFKLNQKGKEIRKWISEFKLRKYFLSIIYYVPPIIGIYLFRIKHKLVWFRMLLRKNELAFIFI